MHLTKLTIKNFRGLKDFTCDKFSQVTVIGGKNNAGKSSILEAIFLVSGMSNASMLPKLNKFRKLPVHRIHDISPNFYNNDFENRIKIELQGDNQTRTLTLQADYLRETDIVQEDAPSSQIEYDSIRQTFSIQGESFYTGEVFLKESTQPEARTPERDNEIFGNSKNRLLKATRDLEYNEQLNTLYLLPFARINLADLLAPMFKDGEIQFLYSILQHVEPNFQALELIGNDVYVKYNGSDTLQPLSLLGDGAVKIITTLTHLWHSKNGIICIDEIENGLHYSVLEQLLQTILSAAKEWDVQVVMTTHNIEILQALAEVLNQTETQSFYYLNLVKWQDGTTIAFSHTPSSFVTSIEQGLEVR